MMFFVQEDGEDHFWQAKPLFILLPLQFGQKV
jgi:hypothetical protein